MHARLILGWLIVVTLPGIAAAQGDYATALYGRGVHAYYDGNYVQAQGYFDDAVAMGSNDPRLYYFSALTKMNQGRSYEAEADIRRAATLEVQGAGTYDVGRALERVQGRRRLDLERQRRDAKLVALRQSAQQAPTTDDQQYLRGPVSAAPTQPQIDPGGLAPDATDPYAASSTRMDTPPTQPPQAEATRDDDMLFGPQDGGAAAPDGGADPFGAADTAATPTVPMKPGSSKKMFGSLLKAVTRSVSEQSDAAAGSVAEADEADNLFEMGPGEELADPEGEDFFGNEAPDAETGGEDMPDDPFGGPPAPSEENPFEAAPAPSDDDPPGGPQTPPDEEVDPFSDDAADVELDDPFGGA